VRGEKARQEIRALVGQDPAAHVGSVRQSSVAHHVPQ